MYSRMAVVFVTFLSSFLLSRVSFPDIATIEILLKNRLIVFSLFQNKVESLKKKKSKADYKIFAVLKFIFFFK